MKSAVKILVSLSLLFFAAAIGPELWSREPSQEELNLEDFQPRKEPEKTKPKIEKPTPKPKPKPEAQPRREKAPAVKSGGQIWKEPVTGMVFVRVPGGCYQMGCGPWAGECGEDNKTVREVCLDGFWMGKYEVTQAQWEKVMGSNPSQFKKGPNYPVEQISWNDAGEFIRKLNERSGGKYALRLPTEAEWEYACRSEGKKERHSGGNDADQVAWYVKNSGSEIHEVGKKVPNALGLFDMNGNMWEWCEDVYNRNAYDKLLGKNPVSTAGSSDRVIRGGSWLNSPGHACCVYRSFDKPASRNSSIGLRLARKE